MDPADAKSICKRLDALKSARATWDAHWEQVRQIGRPSSATFQGTQTPGGQSRQVIFDQTLENALDLLAAGLQAALSNPQVLWFDLRVDDERLMARRSVQDWLHAAKQVLYGVFNSPRARFHTAQHEKYLDLAAFGTGVGYVAERPGDIPLFSARPLEECYLAEDAEGQIDTLYRCFKLSAEQAKRLWGEAAGAKALKAAADPSRMHEEFEFVHAVAPREVYDPQKIDAANMPVASVFVARDDMQVVATGGYREFPFQVPRWSKRAGEVYGRGPGMKALPDTKMLQRGMKVTIRAHEKSIDPPLQVADDGVMGKIDLTAGAINAVRWDMLRGGGGAIRPIETGARPDVGEAFLQSVRERIQETALTPLFRFARNPQMTATQVLELTEQSMQQLNPILGRLQDEDLGPVIDRTLAICLRQGLVDPPPEILEGRELLFEYVSPIAKAARVGEARAVSQLVEILAPLASLDPSVLDLMDPERTPRALANTLGVPPQMTRSAEEVSEVRAARAAALRQQQELELAERIGKAAGDAAPALRELQGGAA